MFKFKSRISKKGNYFFEGTFHEYKDGMVVTDNEELAKVLRRNHEFVEIRDEKDKKKTDEKDKK